MVLTTDHESYNNVFQFKEKSVSNLPFTDGSFTGAEADLDFSTPRTVADNLLEKELRK